MHTLRKKHPEAFNDVVNELRVQFKHASKFDQEIMNSKRLNCLNTKDGLQITQTSTVQESGQNCEVNGLFV